MLGKIMPSKSKKTIKSKKTRKAPCEVCTIRKISRKSGLYKLRNGDTHLRAFLPPDVTIRENPQSKHHQLEHQLETVRLEGLKPNSVLFYFATNSKDFRDNIEHFADAYDKLQNSGVVRTNAKGHVEVRVGCPQVYLAEDGNVYSRHFHIIYWNAKLNGWDKKIYTHQIFCNVNKAFVRKMISAKSKSTKNVVIVDALDKSYFEKNHIPGAVNLPASHKWTLAEVMQRMPKGVNATTPIIIYCYSPTCTAAEKLWMQMTTLGFYNTMHYVGGITDWNS